MSKLHHSNNCRECYYYTPRHGMCEHPDILQKFKQKQRYIDHAAYTTKQYSIRIVKPVLAYCKLTDKYTSMHMNVNGLYL